MTMYDFEELKNKALSPDATKEDRMNLLDWFQAYGDRYWNGEYFDIENGRALYPIYSEVDEDEFEITDAEVR